MVVRRASDRLEYLGQTGSESFRDPLNVHQRHVPDSPLDPAVIGPMQSTPLCSFFLVNSLLLADAADSTTESNADVERHCPTSSICAAYAYTADKSHLSLTRTYHVIDD